MTPDGEYRGSLPYRIGELEKAVRSLEERFDESAIDRKADLRWRVTTSLASVVAIIGAMAFLFSAFGGSP